MRREFHPIILNHMRRDDRIWVCTADLGYRMLDVIAAEFPNRFVNVGAAEQLLLGTAVGLAEEGLIPVCYTITPFYWRAAEWIRNYVDHERVPVKLIGAGRGGMTPEGLVYEDYRHDGWTHYAADDVKLFSCFPNIITYWPETVESLPRITDEWLYNDRPSYLNLRR